MNPRTRIHAQINVHCTHTHMCKLIYTFIYACIHTHITDMPKLSAPLEKSDIHYISRCFTYAKARGPESASSESRARQQHQHAVLHEPRTRPVFAP